jgi:hypothetical protein
LCFENLRLFHLKLLNQLTPTVYNIFMGLSSI